MRGGVVRIQPERAPERALGARAVAFAAMEHRPQRRVRLRERVVELERYPALREVAAEGLDRSERRDASPARITHGRRVAESLGQRMSRVNRNI